MAGIMSAAGHYSNATLAGWLGLGVANLHAIPTDNSMAMRLDLLEATLDNLYGDGYVVPFVLATFGTTDAFGIDNVAAIAETIDRKATQHKAVRPHLHVDVTCPH